MVFVISTILSVMTVYLLVLWGSSLGSRSFLYSLARAVDNSIGIIPVMFFVAAVLFVIFFFLLTQRSIRYIEEISKSLEKIEAGQFDTRITVRSSDELGRLAERINQMSSQLMRSLEDERNAERTKNELITSVSHDLRTPLTSILGYLGLIVNDRCRDELELRYYADIAYQKSNKLKKLIDELFEFTRINCGGIKLRVEKINLTEMLEQLVEEFFPIFQEAGLQSRLILPRGKVFIIADGDLLARVFDNLITNAIRYGSEGRYVDVELSVEAKTAVIRVVNYGNPIPAADLPYIFDKFYRVERSRSEATGGTGLGLAIAKNIVELHSGTISASSDDTKTVFEARLGTASPEG